jgi:hypothetical protein
MVSNKIKIELSEYKYGSLNGVEVIEFDNRVEVLEWIKKSIEFTEYTEREESEAGESLCKYTGRFTFEGVKYSIYLDY